MPTPTCTFYFSLVMIFKKEVRYQIARYTLRVYSVSRAMLFKAELT